MDYSKKLSLHYRPQKGWINDPNGLVFFKGYYHIFYQHAPNCELPFKDEEMHWGHARTKDFVNWEELPVALYPDKPYDRGGCWSGTAIVKDGILYLFYASVVRIPGETKQWSQTVSMAYSEDGINFKKYEKNPIIDSYPADGCPDFRDPAVAFIDGSYYLVMASGNPQARKARLLLYKSENLTDWAYNGIMAEWDNGRCAECPSFVQSGDKCFLSASVLTEDDDHYFSIMYGGFKDGKFTAELSAEIDKGPDQYAGQMFKDDKGRCILISWLPGWSYAGFAEKDIGCMSVPRRISVKDNKLVAYPVEEMQQYLKDSDSAVKRTKDGFVIERNGRDDVVYHGKIDDLKILRDEFIAEVFVNGGEEEYTVLL